MTGVQTCALPILQDKMKELGKGKELPAILTGDFNVDQTHQSYDAFVSKGGKYKI